MKNDPYSVRERLGFYLLQLLLKFYRKINKEGCSKTCEKCLKDLISRTIDIETKFKLKKFLQRYLLPASSFKDL